MGIRGYFERGDMQGFKKRSSAQAPLAENGGQIRISQKIWGGHIEKMSESQTKAGNQEKLKNFENLKIWKIWNF